MLEKSGQNGILREEYMSAVRRADAARQKVQDFRLDEREQSYTRAKQSAAEMQKLVEQRLATGAEAEQSARDAENQSHSLEAARQQWQQLKRDAEDADAQLRIIKMRTEQGADAELLAVRKELEEAKIAYELAAGRLTGLQVVAARKGTVLAVNIAPGDRVLLGTPLFRLSDLSTLDVQVSVSAKVAREIKAGTSVKVRLPTEPPQEMKAQVNSVLLVPDAESQGYQVKITIPNPDPDVILAGLDCAVVFPYITGGESWIKRLF